MECEEEGKLVRVECLPPALKRNSQVPTTFRTFLVKVEDINHVKQESGFSSSYHLQAILFDEKYGCFVGSCWQGKPVQSDISQVSFNQGFCFYTSIPVKELLLVIELITPSKVPNRFKTCGWMGVSLSEEEEEKVGELSTARYTVPLIHGSPISLIPPVRKITKKAKKKKKKKKEAELLEKRTGMEISLSRSPYPHLLHFAHLVPENLLFDFSYEIPGLVSNSLQEAHNEMHMFKPQLQTCITFALERLCIGMHPSREAIEKEIMEKIHIHMERTMRPLSSKSTVPPKLGDLVRPSIVQRRLQVAVHNGYCFIQEPDFYHLHAESPGTTGHAKTLRRTASMGTLNACEEDGLVMRSDIKLFKIPDNSGIAIVFLLEYIISFPNADEKQPSSSLSKNPTANIPIAWGFCYLGELKENPYHHIILSSRSNSSPYNVRFLRTEQDYPMSFSAISLLKQNKDYATSVLPEEHMSTVSTSSRSEASTKAPNLRSILSKSSAKHKSIADIPMTVIQNESGSSRRENPTIVIQKSENNLALQEVTLVPSSLPLVPPLLHSFPLEPGESFKAFTKFYWDKLHPILDHQGKPATCIESAVPYRINADLELEASPQKNECMIQLLAISALDEFVEVPIDIYFTFQFYRFLPIRSESLSLKWLSENSEDEMPKSSFVYALVKTRGKDKVPGFQVTYNIDPTELNKGEYRPFLQYLMKQTLHIDLYNGHSLLYFGTVALPLKYFCRQGKEAVFSNLELDIFNCEFLDESLGQGSLPMKKPLGKLHLRLASIRHPLSSKALENMGNYGKTNLDSVVINSSRENSSTDMPTCSVSKARRIAETDRELSKLLATRCVRDNSKNMSPDPHLTEERRRKLARMEAVRNLENNKDTNYNAENGMHFFFKEKQRDLLSIEAYIQKNKSELIQSFLHKSVTSEKVIYPIIGSKEFFEFVIENPFPDTKRVEIIWKCPELCLVSDNKLWQILRNVHCMSQKVGPLSLSDASVLLQPKEKAHVPFTYQCLKTSQLGLLKAVTGHHFSADVLSSLPVLNSLDTCIKVKFMTDDHTLLSILNLKIQPLPPSFTHTFKFLSMEHSMFNKSIQIIRADGNMSNTVSVECSHSEVVCSISESQDLEENINVHIKAPTRSAGKCTDFYVFIYKDRYEIVPLQTWSISLCPLQRIDLSCIAGQLMRSSLLIRGTHATNLVRCSSSSKELQLHPSDPFVLSPFSVQELSMNIRCLMPGIKHFQITLVNETLELVLQSWLLVLNCQKPSVSKAFQVHLSIGKEAAKRITYTSPYSHDRSFVLHASHPHLLKLRESHFSVSANQNYCLGLYFQPQEFIFTETIFLYLNDATLDKNEETYCIKVLCQ